MQKNILILIFSLLLGAVIFSTVRYAGALQVKGRLELKLNETKKQLGFLEGQLRQGQELINNLNEEKAFLSDSLEEAEGKISQASLKQAQSQARIFSLVDELEDLYQENSEIKEEKAHLEERLGLLEEQNAEAFTRLHSIAELKKAIRELKTQMRKTPLKIKPQASKSQTEVIRGNSGYLIRGGLPTYRPRIKIEVKSAQ